MAASDDERRRIAARLRSVAHEVMRSGYSENMKHVRLAVFEDLDQYRPNETLNRLADLIDPGESGHESGQNRDTVQIESPDVQKTPECDREALLELAQSMMVRHSWLSASDAARAKRIADHIREACGEVVE